MTDKRTALDLRRAWRLVGVFAPVAMLVVVCAVPLAVWGVRPATYLSFALPACVPGIAGWAISRGGRVAVRLGAVVLSTVAGVGAALLALRLLGGALSFSGSLLPALLFGGMIAVPWAVLVAGGTMAARVARYPGNAAVTIWWILAIGAAGLSVPLVWWMSFEGLGDDMSMLLLFIAPCMAMGLWLGPLTLVAGVALLRRLRAGTASSDTVRSSAAEALQGGS